MRVAIFNTIRSYGGGEKRVLYQALELGRRGQETVVLGRADGKLVPRCAQEGIPVTPVPLKQYYSPATIRATAAALSDARPDVVLCSNEGAVRIAALARRWVPGAPPLVYYYGLEASFKNKPFNRLVVAPQVSHIVSNSQAGYDELASFGWIPKDRLHVIYDGVDPLPIQQADPTGVREALGAGPDDVVVLVAARLVPEKGHAFLLETLAAMKPALQGVRVWIAGHGPLEEELGSRIRALGLEENVRLLGFRTDLPRLLRAADLLCHPSRREGAPNAVLEAMVAGLPVAAVAASGTPELVQHGETGLLSAIGDQEGLQKNLETLLRDQALRVRMGEAGSRRALSGFTEQRSAELWTELLLRCARDA